MNSRKSDKLIENDYQLKLASARRADIIALVKLFILFIIGSIGVIFSFNNPGEFIKLWHFLLNSF